MAVNSVRRNGSYAPLSAHYYKDDAIDEAGPDAELLYVRGLAFCADVLSDGFISDRQLVRFVGVGMDDAAERAKRLVAVDLWERVDGGYRVRSWLDWNRSREEITERQAKDAQRKAKDRGVESASSTPEPPPDGPPSNSGGNPSGLPPESSDTPETVRTESSPRARAPRHSTPRNSTPAPTAPRDARPDPARGLIDEWIASRRKHPPRNVIQDTERWVKALLRDDIDPDDIRTGLRVWADKGLSPAVLPSVVNEVMNACPPTARGAPRTRTTDDKRAAVRGLVAQVMGTSALHPDATPPGNVRALPQRSDP